MRLKSSLLVLIAICVGGGLSAQVPVTPQVNPAAPFLALDKAISGPTETDVYCAGFITHRTIEPDLFVLGGEDGVLKYEYAAGDFIYLNRGRNLLKTPGAQYMIVRPVKDLNDYEAFIGQRRLLLDLGTQYAAIARVQIQILNEETATAEILNSCEPAQAGDIAVPFGVQPIPPYKQVKFTERFAPASGKATGVIAATKDMGLATGANEIVYLNLGSKQGLQVGSYLRVFHSYLSQDDDPSLKGTRDYPTDMNGVPEGHRLTRKEKEVAPRAVTGEIMILSVEEGSSTGIVTYSIQDMYAGDAVEIE